MPDIFSSLLDLDLSKLLPTLLSTLLTLVICLIAVRVIMKLVKTLMDRTSVDETIKKYVPNVIKIALWIVTILICAQQLGIEITSLVALLSVLTLAISLAVQTVLSNIAGGLVVLVTKPFKVGDFIETPDGAGAVDCIQLTATQIVTPDGLRLVIPNSTIAAGKIVNYTVQGKRRVVHKITASYNAPVDTVRKACLEAAAQTANILDDPAPVVFVSAYGESSIEYVIHVWTGVDTYWDVYFSLLEQIKVAFDKSGVEMTYNHLNVHIVEK